MVERSIFTDEALRSMSDHVPSVSEQLAALEVEEDRRGVLDLDNIPDEKLWERGYSRNDDAAFEAMLGAKMVQYTKLLVRPFALARTIREDLVGATKNKTKELVLRGLVRAQEGISGERIVPDPLAPERLRHLFGSDAEVDGGPLSDMRSYMERVHDDKLPDGVIAFNAVSVGRRLRRLFETTKTAEDMAAAATKAFDEKTLKSVVTLWGVWTWSSNIFGWRARTGDENQRVQGTYWLLRKQFELSTDMTKYDLAHNFMADEIVEAEPKITFGCLDPAYGDTKERQVALWDNDLVSIGDKKWSKAAFVNEFYLGADGRYEAPLDTNDGVRRARYEGWRRPGFDPNEHMPSADEYVSIAPETYKAVADAIGQLPVEEPLDAVDSIMDVVEAAAAGSQILSDDDDFDAE